MKKFSLIFIITSIACVFSQFNIKTEQKIANLRKCSQIITQIAEKYESNNSLKLSYDNILTSISESNYFENINKKSFPIITQSFRDYFLNKNETGNFDDITFKYKNINYVIKVNIGTYYPEEFNKFEKIFNQSAYDKIEDTLNNLVSIAVISELSHYYSINSNTAKITQAIHIIKDLIFSLDHQSYMKKDAKFLSEIKSWDLNQLIINYKNKIYTDKLDYYRNIDFDAIKFDDNTSTDFDYFQFQYCDNFKFAHLVPTTHPVEKVFTGYLNVLFKDANNQDMFSTSQIQTMDARLKTVYHLGDLELYGLFIFSDPFDSQIIQIKN